MACKPLTCSAVTFFSGTYIMEEEPVEVNIHRTYWNPEGEQGGGGGLQWMSFNKWIADRGQRGSGNKSNVV